jgi:ATP-dependent RNA helicase DDX24/MAK5
MIEAGHFAELDNILRLTLRTAPYVHFHLVNYSPIKQVMWLIREDQIEPELDSDTLNKEYVDDDNRANSMQTFVVSATLSKDLQRNLKKRSRPLSSKKVKTSTSTLGTFFLAYRPHVKIMMTMVRRR